MPAQRLRPNTHMHPMSKTTLKEVQVDLESACEGQHQAFFRPGDNRIVFTTNGVRYRIDVAEANDPQARTQMHLQPNDVLLHAHLQAGGQTYANVIYPGNSGSVQLSTLLAAIVQSIQGRADFTAIH